MKTKKIITLAMPVLALISCVREESTNDILTQDIESTSANEIHVCVDKIIDIETEGSKSGKALLEDKLWDNGSTLKVKFIDDNASQSLQDRVMEQARKWEQYANIKFEVVTSGDSDIRISFDSVDGGSWSYIGTDANYRSEDQATMNFGWFFDYTSNSEIQRTTLHEFGHALGAIHEHNSPASTIQWNKEVVYEYYMETQGWTEAQVDNNLFNKYSDNVTTNSEYDPDSIMHYAINSEFTLDGFSVGWNYDLSDIDKSFIEETYPFDDDTNEEPSENLAYGKETSQLSTAASGDSSRAVDGNTSGVWSENSVTHTEDEYRPWWQVRLGQEYAIGDITIWNRTDSCCASRLQNIDVFIYDDNGDQAYKTTITDIPYPSVTINAGGAIGSRVRVKLRDTNPLSLAEVEVFEY